MDIVPIVIVAGAASIVVLPILAKRSASKKFLNASDRRLIESKLQCASFCRRAIVMEILIILLFCFIFFSKARTKQDSEGLYAVFIALLVGIIGTRAAFKQMIIAAEVELEYRRRNGKSI